MSPPERRDRLLLFVVAGLAWGETEAADKEEVEGASLVMWSKLSWEVELQACAGGGRRVCWRGELEGEEPI